MVFWADVSWQIGMGHLMECLAIAESFQKCQIPFHFIINPYPPAEDLLLSKSISFDLLPIRQVTDICKSVRTNSKRKCVIVNHRNVLLSSLERLKEESFNVIVIDQLGNKEVNCDLLINSTMVPEWLNYGFTGEPPECCFGPDFAILRNDFMRFHQKEKSFPQDKRTVLVSMGGVDRSGATVRIVEALQLLKEPVSKEIILGKGFAHMDRFQRVYEKINDPYLTFAQGIDDLAERMQKADIVISTGGNTVYEMACVGTPGLILWEDPHEDRQGRVFEEKGAVWHLGNGRAASVLDICNSIEQLLNDTRKRIQMSERGKSLVDACGTNRILGKIMSLIKE